MNYKKYLVVFLVVLIMLFGGRFIYKYQADNVSKIDGMLIEVKTVEEMSKIIDENEVVYVYMGRPNCSDSDAFEEYFDDMIEDYELQDKVYFFNVVDIYNNNEKNNKYKEILNNEFGLQYTPSLAKFENGELVLVSQWTPATGYYEADAKEFIEESGLND